MPYEVIKPLGFLSLVLKVNGICSLVLDWAIEIPNLNHLTDNTDFSHVCHSGHDAGSL